ncbi:MAG: hypothetical protein V1915_02850 [Candidatus Bathyarchaeota archaeon]
MTKDSLKTGTQQRLEKELERLKSKFGLAGHLSVVWDPRPSSEEVHGMVRNSTIFVFDTELEEALRTLKHEFIEYILTQEFLEPRLFEAKAHRRADALVDIIARLL